MWSFASANTPPRSPALIHIAGLQAAEAPSERGIDTPWLYGYTVDWNDPRAKRCCSRYYVNRVLPARLKAEGNS